MNPPQLTPTQQVASVCDLACNMNHADLIVAESFALKLAQELEAAQARIETLEKKWESKKPGTSGALFLGVLSAIADACPESMGNSRPPSFHVRTLAARLQSSEESVAAMRTALKKLLAMAYQEERDRSGDPTRAESYACVRTIKEALSITEPSTPEALHPHHPP